MGCSTWGANFLYVLDISAPMKGQEEKAVAELLHDLDAALGPPAVRLRAGDQIYLWTFDAEVNELVRLDYRPGAEKTLKADVRLRLEGLRPAGKPNLGRLLVRALQQFGPPQMGELDLFIYTEGQANIPGRESDAITQLYKDNYEPYSRLPHLTLIRYGKKGPPKETAKVIAALGGELAAGGQIPASPPIQASETNHTAVAVSPRPTTATTNLAATTSTNLTVATRTNSPPAANPIPPKELANANPATNQIPKVVQASVKTNAPPVAAVPAPPIMVELVPPDDSARELPPDGQWRALPGASLSFSSSDLERLSANWVRFGVETPGGVELRVVPEGRPTQFVPLGRVIQLGTLGQKFGFQIRASSTESAGQDLKLKLSVNFAPGQTVRANGNLILPVRFALPVQAQVVTREISLGELVGGAASVTRNLELRVQGAPDGRRLRVTKQGEGLAGVSVTPELIALQAGNMSVELTFTGLDARSPGPIDGALILTPEGGESAVFRAPTTTLAVHGRVLSAPAILAEIDDPMVAGQPIVIRARLDSGEKLPLNAIVRPHYVPKETQLELRDSGVADDADLKANDGIYSGSFRETAKPGRYQIVISCAATNRGVRPLTAAAPIYFQVLNSTLTGTLISKKRNEKLPLRATVLSEYPTELAFVVESTPGAAPLETELAAKTLKPGENILDLLVTPTPGASAGRYRFALQLVTEPINGKRARIPLNFDIALTPIAAYIFKLAMYGLAAAGVLVLLIIAPWRRTPARPATTKQPVEPAAPAPGSVKPQTAFKHRINLPPGPKPLR